MCYSSFERKISLNTRSSYFSFRLKILSPSILMYIVNASSNSYAGIYKKISDFISNDVFTFDICAI